MMTSRCYLMPCPSKRFLIMYILNMEIRFQNIVIMATENQNNRVLLGKPTMFSALVLSYESFIMLCMQNSKPTGSMSPLFHHMLRQN